MFKLTVVRKLLLDFLQFYIKCVCLYKYVEFLTVTNIAPFCYIFIPSGSKRAREVSRGGKKKGQERKYKEGNERHAF